VSRSSRLVFALSVVIFAGDCCRASSIYIAQTASGPSTGANCAEAHSASWFNTLSNWKGGGSIGPGTTVHLCGNISTPLVIHGSGSKESPITILFESGATMSAPNWGESGSAITGRDISYLTIDGGTNGTIRAESNGTYLATNVNEAGVSLYNCSNCVVRNLTVADMYKHASAPTDEGGQGSMGIYVANGSNISIYNSTVHDMKWCIFYSFTTPGNSNVAIYDNTAYHCDHGVVVGSGDPSATLDVASVYGNTIYDAYLWDDNANENHHDGIHVWSVHSASAITGLQLYNNYIYGNWGQHFTALIFMQAQNTGTENSALAFNNLLVDSTPVGHFGCGLLCVMANLSGIYNNTLVGPGQTSDTGINIYGTSETVENNVFSNMLQVVHISGSASASTWDYNNYYNVGPRAWNWASFTAWQSRPGPGVAYPDGHGSFANSNLDAFFHPTVSSITLIQKAINLTGLSNQELDADKSGIKRPSPPTMWTAGAYQLVPISPTGLSGVVH
jgi:hypothetical protein